MNITRLDIPDQLINPTDWSDRPDMNGTHTLIAALKGRPQLLRILEDRAAEVVAHSCLPPFERPAAHGPERMNGSWVLAYIGLTLSGSSNIQPWHTRMKDQPGFWELCGFPKALNERGKLVQVIPAYQTAYQRLVELQGYEEEVEDKDGNKSINHVGLDQAFAEAATEIMRTFIAQDDRVAAWWHIDATEAQTNGVARHDCQDGDHCPTPRARAVRADNMFVAELRRKGVDKAVAAEEAGQAAEESDEEIVVWHEGLTQLRVRTKVLIPETNRVRVFANGHYWSSRDKDAGTRAYRTNGRLTKFWHGYSSQVVVDHFTRLPLAIHLFPADRNEEQEYETIYGIATGNTGKDPVLVAGDRGLSFSHIFEFNTRHGVGSVFQYRRFGAKLPVHAPRGENYDEHGVPECQHCGGLTDFVRFALDKGTGSPRLWVRCAFPVTDKCEKEQAISCSKDWRRLLPVWRTHPAYEAMTESHQIYEGKHAALRRNYLVGPDDDKLRPCRVGIPLAAASRQLCPLLGVAQV